MSSPRKRRKVRVAIAVAAAGLLAAGWLLLLPKWVIHVAKEQLAARGLVGEVGGARVALNGLVLTELAVRSSVPGVQATLARVAVEVRPWRGFGAAAVRTLQVEGVRLRVDLRAGGLRELLRARRRLRADGQAAGRAGERPTVRVSSMELGVLDAAGVLITASGISATLDRQGWAVSGSSAAVGGAPGEAIALRELRVAGAWDGRRPVLVRGAASSGVLHWVGESNSAVASDGFPAGTGRTVARLRAALADIRGAEPGPVAASTPGRQALWGPGAEVTLSHLQVLSGFAPEEREVLSDLSVVLKAEGSDAVRARIRGTGAGAGGLSLDLRLLPRAMRVEGRLDLEDVSLALFAPVLPPLPFFELERTKVDAHLSLKAQGLEAMLATGEIEVRDLAFAAEGLAKLPVGPIGMTASGEGEWTPARRELRLARAELGVGAVRASGAGLLAWPAGGYRVDGSLQVSKAPCQDWVRALPVALLDELSSVTLEGELAAKLLVHVDSSDLDGTKVAFDVDDACKFVALPSVLDLTRFQQPFIHRVLEPEGEIFEFETGPGSAAWTPIELVTPFMIQAAVAHEDGRFFTHHGFAEPEIATALARNLKARAFRFGASTITMQLVKNVFLHREKLLSRKVQEAFITWWLEQQWDKRHILELYLNVIEYGPGIYGIRNAAWHYFGTIPMNLTPAQSAFLASILPSPKTMHAQYDAGTLSPSMKARLVAFLKHMRARERIDEEALQFGLEELEHFTFYRPDQPPPPVPMIRGTAQSPPFDLPTHGPEAWDDYDAPLDAPVEDGSFGSAD